MMDGFFRGLGAVVFWLVVIILFTTIAYYATIGVRHSGNLRLIIPVPTIDVPDLSTRFAPGTPGGGYIHGAPRSPQECVARGGQDTGRGCTGYQ